MRLSQLLHGVAHTAEHFTDVPVSDLAYDSRKVSGGSVFFCLTGAQADGHAFAQSAVQSGACALVVEHPVQLETTVPVICVQNARLALAQMSAAFFAHPAAQLSVIGITGTKGKTTTAAMLRSILQQANLPTGVIGTVGVQIGNTITPTANTTPESYELQKALRQMVDAGCKAAILEASSIGLRAHRTAGMTFAVGVFTNFSQDHIGGVEHRGMHEYLRCKQLLFQQSCVAAVNCDDAVHTQILSGSACTETCTYGFSPQADFRAQNEQLLRRSGSLGVGFSLQSARFSGPIEVPIPGSFSVYNALAAISAASFFPQVQLSHLQAGLSAVHVRGRVEPVPVSGDYTLLIDYAHNAMSMQSLLQTLRAYRPNRLICLFGAGGNRSKTRRFEVGEVCGKLADLSVITADNSRFEPTEDILKDIQTGLNKTGGAYVAIPDRREAIAYCMQHAQPGDIIVLAGKGHEDYQEIGGIKHPFDERQIVLELDRIQSAQSASPR